MPDYQKSKIYKLYSPSKKLIYYGSTIETLAQRLAKHKSQHKKYNNDNTKTFLTSFLVLECEDYKIELVEEYPCNNRQQLEKKEGEYIKNNECCNKIIVGRTDKEYREDNIDKIKEYNKEYRIDNADKLKEYDRLRNQTETRKEYNKLRNQTEARKAYQKEYDRQRYLKKKLEKE
jgi:hypothetical protein